MFSKITERVKVVVSFFDKTLFKTFREISSLQYPTLDFHSPPDSILRAVLNTSVVHLSEFKNYVFLLFYIVRVFKTTEYVEYRFIVCFWVQLQRPKRENWI